MNNTNGIYTLNGGTNHGRMWKYRDGVWYVSNSQGWGYPAEDPPASLVKVANL